MILQRQHFLLSYLKTLSVGPVGVSNSRPPASQPGAQPSEQPVRGVQTLDSAIHWINHYPLDNSIGFASVYPLDSDLSGGQRYPLFEQLGPGQ